jgi:hypothetical protein
MKTAIMPAKKSVGKNRIGSSKPRIGSSTTISDENGTDRIARINRAFAFFVMKKSTKRAKTPTVSAVTMS